MRSDDCIGVVKVMRKRKIYSILCACFLISLLMAGFPDVRAVNDPPVAVALPELQMVSLGDPAFFNGENSYDPDGSIRFLPNVQVESERNSHYPRVAIGPTGMIHVVWFRNPDIYYSESNDGGETFGSPVAVNDDVAPTGVWSAVAVDLSGNVHVVWSDSRNEESCGDPPERWYDIYYDMKPSGGTFGTDIRVNSDPYCEDYQGDSEITTDGAGNAHVVWSTKEGSSDDVYYAKKPAGGSFQTEMIINDVTLGLQAFPRISSDGGGNLHVVWIDGRNNPSCTRHGSPPCDVYYAKSIDNGNSFVTPNLLVNKDSVGGFIDLPDVAADSSGNPHVVWEEVRATYTHIYYSKSTDGGASFPPTSVEVTTGLISFQRFAFIDTDSGDNPMVVWNSFAGTVEVRFTRSKDGGQTFEDSQLVNGGGTICLHPHMAIEDRTNVHVVWEDNRVKTGEVWYGKGTPTLSFDWDFGDGSPHSDEPSPQHIYANCVRYEATLTVTDGLDASAQDTAIVIVVCPILESSIYGYKWDDINANGLWEATSGGGYDEPAVSLYPFSLYYYSPIELDWIFVRMTLTDAQGRFDFDPLPAGLYVVVEEPKIDWVPTGCLPWDGVCQDFNGNPSIQHARINLPASTDAFIASFGNHYLGGPEEPSYVVSVGVGGSDTYQVQHNEEFDVTVEITNSGDLESHLKYLRFQAAIEDKFVVLFAEPATHPASYDVYLHTGELKWSGDVVGVLTQELHAGLGGGMYDMMSWSLPPGVVLEGELPTGEKGLVVFRFTLVAIGYPPSTTKVQFFLESTEDHHPVTAPTLPQITDKANIWTNYTSGTWYPAHNSFDPFDMAYASSHRWQSNCWQKNKWIEKITTHGYAHIDISVEIVP